MINKKWVLGTNNECTYAVMTLDDKVLFECGTNIELAKHVIEIHNREIDNEAKTKKGWHYCHKHGGFGFQSTCVECNKE